ncbi:hypothetical protein ACFLX5_04055 [Chloroflexota bacterium]
MNDQVENIEVRIRALEEKVMLLTNIEDIKRLRGRYWRCIREHLWDDLLDCFAEDAKVDLGFGMRM